MAPTIDAMAEQPIHEKNAYANHPQRSVWKRAKNVTRWCDCRSTPNQLKG
jgi:hypothetical protein